MLPTRSCNIGNHNELKYDDPSSWKGMAFRTAKRGGALIVFEKVLENHQKVIELLNEY